MVGTKFTLHIDWEQQRQVEEEMHYKARKVLYLIMNKFAQITSNIVSNEATDTGNLAQGIATSLTPKVANYKKYTVSDQTDYGIYVNEGTKPHFPPVEELKDWARRVLGDESLAYPVAVAISRRGTHPVKFWQRGIAELEERWIPAITNQVFTELY